RHRLRGADRERRRRGRHAAVLIAALSHHHISSTGTRMDANEGQNTATLMERVLYEVKRVVVGQDRFLERVMVAMLAQGQLLVEGVPGLAKTLTVKTLAQTMRGTFRRIQFTPDLLPADPVGTPSDHPQS